MIGIWYFIVLIIVLLGFWAIEKTRDVFKIIFPEIIFFISSFFFLMADIKSSSEEKFIGTYSWKDLNIFFIISGSFIFLFGCYLSYLKNIEFKDFKINKQNLQSEKSKHSRIKEEYYSLCSDIIKDYFSDFFHSSTGNARVSLYKHQGTHFTLLARYSDAPVYNKRGREVYDDNQGFISLGWQSGTCEIHGAPAWKSSGISYKSFMKNKCNITDTILQTLKMKSRSFYIYRFDSSNSQNPYGIIVFERLQDTQIPTTIINNIFTTRGNEIIRLFKSMNSLDS